MWKLKKNVDIKLLKSLNFYKVIEDFQHYNSRNSFKLIAVLIVYEIVLNVSIYIFELFFILTISFLFIET